jgi:hypothetical protein
MSKWFAETEFVHGIAKSLLLPRKEHYRDDFLSFLFFI